MDGLRIADAIEACDWAGCSIGNKEILRAAVAALRNQPVTRSEAPYEFDRYVGGKLMAEGVTIERASSLQDAADAAARIASRGPRGEVPVLVMRP